jgi:hypothetical protein
MCGNIGYPWYRYDANQYPSTFEGGFNEFDLMGDFSYLPFGANDDSDRILQSDSKLIQVIHSDESLRM